jgi:hypothetical protein
MLTKAQELYIRDFLEGKRSKEEFTANITPEKEVVKETLEQKFKRV